MKTYRTKLIKRAMHSIDSGRISYSCVALYNEDVMLAFEYWWFYMCGSGTRFSAFWPGLRDEAAQGNKERRLTMLALFMAADGEL